MRKAIVNNYASFLLPIKKMRLFKFLHYQRYVGLNDLDYSSSRDRYSLSANWLSYSIRSLIQLTLLISILVALWSWSLNFQDTNFQLVNIFDHIVILAGVSTQFLTNIWMHLHQKSQLKLVQRLSHVASRLHLKNLETPYTCWIYRLWIFIIIYYGIDIIAFIFNDMGSDHQQLKLLPGFFLRVLCATFIITCYSSLLLSITYLMATLTAQLESRITNGRQISAKDLANYLYLYDEIQLVCQEDMSQIYGGALVLTYLYSTLDATETYFLALPMEYFSCLKMLLLLRWLMPNIIYMSMPMLINNLANEVSIKILKIYIVICSMN